MDQIIIALLVFLGVVLLVGTMRHNPTDKYIRDLLADRPTRNQPNTSSGIEKSAWLLLLIAIVLVLFVLTGSKFQ